MKHLKTLLPLFFVLLVTACNTKPIISKETLQGTWTCFDFTIMGEGITPTMEAQSKEVALMNSYVFSGDTLTIENQFFSIATTYRISEDAKKIEYTPIGYKNMSPGTFHIHEFTGEVLIIQEIQHGVTTTNFLQKKME